MRSARLTAGDVARAVDRSLTRLGVEALDLVQFHWWDYDVPGAVGGRSAGSTTCAAAGAIRHLGADQLRHRRA